MTERELATDTIGNNVVQSNKKWWTLIVVSAATFMLMMDVTVVIVALPALQSGLHASFSDVQRVVDAYALTLASVLLTAGSLADRYGRRLLFTIGLIVSCSVRCCAGWPRRRSC